MAITQKGPSLRDIVHAAKSLVTLAPQNKAYASEMNNRHDPGDGCLARMSGTIAYILAVGEHIRDVFVLCIFYLSNSFPSTHSNSIQANMLLGSLNLPLAAVSGLLSMSSSHIEPKYTFAFTTPIHPLSNVDIPSAFGNNGCEFFSDQDQYCCNRGSTVI